MKSLVAATLLLGCVASVASAQTQSPAAAPSTPPATASRAAATPPASPIVSAAQLEAGANSFTEGQARSRLEDAGITDVQSLTKDDAGFWRGRGMRGGMQVDVAMDFRGRIAAGPEVASLRAPSPPASGTATPPPASGTTTPAPASPR
jgi:protein CpxP